MRLVLLGDPVDHSRSPAIHQAALDALGIEGSYVTRRTAASELPELCDALRLGSLDGANVTMPLKQRALEAVDRATDVAMRVGAVNTLFSIDGSVRGDNTDVGGISDAWSRRGLAEDAPVLVLGTGGAAAAALVALEGREIHISGRTEAKAAALASRVGVDASFVAWGVAIVGAIVVNATPLGMSGEVLPEDVLTGASGLFDMAYGPVTTAAVASFDRPFVDGIDMLVAQAARSFEIWTGCQAPLAVMEAAARP